MNSSECNFHGSPICSQQIEVLDLGALISRLSVLADTDPANQTLDIIREIGDLFQVIASLTADESSDITNDVCAM